MYVVGVGFVCGYLGRVGLMVECFIVDLFGKLGIRMYCIGDLVCWCNDGMLDYIGCVDY